MHNFTFKSTNVICFVLCCLFIQCCCFLSVCCCGAYLYGDIYMLLFLSKVSSNNLLRLIITFMFDLFDNHTGTSSDIHDTSSVFDNKFMQVLFLRYDILLTSHATHTSVLLRGCERSVRGRGISPLRHHTYLRVRRVRTRQQFPLITHKLQFEGVFNKSNEYLIRCFKIVFFLYMYLVLFIFEKTEIIT